MAALEERWAAAHAASLPLVASLADAAAPTDISASVAAAAARLPAGTLDPQTLRLALSRRSRPPVAERAAALEAHMATLEAVLDDMHALARDARRPRPSPPSSANSKGTGLPRFLILHKEFTPKLPANS